MMTGPLTDAEWKRFTLLWLYRTQGQLTPAELAEYIAFDERNESAVQQVAA